MYTIMATVAAGVLPVEEVANQPLSASAEAFLPDIMYKFFVIGGAIFAISTTLNAGIGSKVYQLAAAAEDGWLPSAIGEYDEKTKTPVNALLLSYILVVIPLILGMDI